MSPRLALISAVVFCACMLPAARAERVESVQVFLADVPAARLIDETLLRRLLHVRPGRACTAGDVDRDLTTLLATGLFDPSPSRSGSIVREGGDGLRIIYRLTPNPIVSGYRFPGLTAIPPQVLEEAVAPLAPLGRPYSLTAAEAIGAALDRRFRDSDLDAHTEAPTVGDDGSVTIGVHEHRVGRLDVVFDGPSLCVPERVLAVAGLERRGLLRPSQLADARRRLLASGVFATVDWGAAPPDEADMVALRLALRAASFPEPASREALALIDPATAARALPWIEPLSLEVPFDPWPEGAAVPATADEAAERARAAFGSAREALRSLCLDLGLSPEPEASLLALARSAASGRIASDLSTSGYARAMDAATEAVLGLREPGAVLACLAEREELLLAREALRGLDAVMVEAPAPLPPFEACAWGDSATLEALLLWRARQPDSPQAAWALGTTALGRCLATRATADDSPDGARCYELGGPTEAARTAGRMLALVARLEPGDVTLRWPLQPALLFLATCATDPDERGLALAAGLLVRPGISRPEALVHAVVGEGGLAGERRVEVARGLASALLEFADPTATEPARLASLALLWAGMPAEADALAREHLSSGPLDAAARALAALGCGRTSEARTLLEPHAEGGEAALAPLLGYCLLAEGDIEAAASAFGLTE